MCVSVYVCVRERGREREKECEHVCVQKREQTSECMRQKDRLSVTEKVHMRKTERVRERRRM